MLLIYSSKYIVANFLIIFGLELLTMSRMDYIKEGFQNSSEKIDEFSHFLNFLTLFFQKKSTSSELSKFSKDVMFYLVLRIYETYSKITFVWYIKFVVPLTILILNIAFKILPCKKFSLNLGDYSFKVSFHTLCI